MVRQICGESPIQTQLSWVVGDLFKPAACQMVWDNVLTREPNPLKCNKKKQLRMHRKKHHHSSWRSIDTITHRTGWTTTAVLFSSFPTASRQRFADESRLPLDRTFRKWGFFCAFCYFGTCVSNCTDKTQDTPTLCNWVWYLAWFGNKVSNNSAPCCASLFISEAYQSDVCWLWNFGPIWRLSSQHSIWCPLVLDFWSGLAISGLSFLIWLFVCVNLI